MSRPTSDGAPPRSRCSAGGFDPEGRGDFLARVVDEVSVGGPGDRVFAAGARHLGLADVAPVGPGESAEIMEVDRLDADLVTGIENGGEILVLLRGFDGPRPSGLGALHRMRIAGVL